MIADKWNVKESCRQLNCSIFEKEITDSSSYSGCADESLTTIKLTMRAMITLTY